MVFYYSGDIGYKYFAVTGCVPVAGIENFTSYITCAATDRQIFVVHFHHEHSQYFGDCYYNKLELQRTQNTQVCWKLGYDTSRSYLKCI